MSPGEIAGLRVILPPHDLMVRFGVAVSPILGAMSLGSRESATLAEVRDALLPQLLSGELAVPAAASRSQAT